MYHKVLERQIKNFFGDPSSLPKPWQDFLQAVSDTYVHSDEDREMAERSLDISSKELGAINAKLAAEKQNFEAKTK